MKNLTVKKMFENTNVTNENKKADENTTKFNAAEAAAGWRCVQKVRDETKLAVKCWFLSGGPRSAGKESLITMWNS